MKANITFVTDLHAKGIQGLIKGFGAASKAGKGLQKTMKETCG